MRASPCGAALLGLLHYIYHSILWYQIGLAGNKWVSRGGGDMGSCILMDMEWLIGSGFNGCQNSLIWVD
jgi:hypothetical protein